MTPPKTVTVGRVVLPLENHAYESRDGFISVYYVNRFGWRAVCYYRPGESMDSGDCLSTPQLAASALTEKLRALRDALADVLGEEEGT